MADQTPGQVFAGSAAVKIAQIEAQNRELMEEFLAFPFTLFAKNPAWIPPSRERARAMWDPRGAFLSRLEARVFLALEQDRVHARCAALVNRHLPDHPGMIGFFDSVEDSEPAHAVLSAAQDWLRQKGKKAVRGPMDGSTWHSYRFITAGSDDPPFFLEPWNPHYYPRFWESFGMTPVKRYFSARVPRGSWDDGRWARDMESCTREGYMFRTVNMRLWKEELFLLFRMSTSIFSRAWGYSDISAQEFLDLYGSLKFLIRPQNLIFALDPAGREKGFLLTLGNEAKRMKAMAASRGLAAKLGFLLMPRETERLIFKTIGVLPGLRKVRLGAALVTYAERLFTREGWNEGIHALMSEDNLSRSFSEGRGQTFRQYALFGKEL